MTLRQSLDLCIHTTTITLALLPSPWLDMVQLHMLCYELLKQACVFFVTRFIQKYFISTAPSSAPESFQASAADPTSISLSWSAPPLDNHNGIIRHYEVTLVALETGELHICTSVALTLTITSLRPYTTYNCTVAAETVAIGPSTTGVLVRTLQTGTQQL